MHEREREEGCLQTMAPVVAREAGASPVTAREAVVGREDPVASTAAPVALGAASMASTTRGSGGSGGVDVGRRRR